VRGGTQGYDERAGELIPRYEAVAFEDKHREALPLLPCAPSRVLDVGAGTGVDAAWFAARGHAVTAVEPVERFRAAAALLHPSPAIEWVDDALPDLPRVVDRGSRFDVIVLAGVWMHLAPAERARGMGVVAGLLGPDGIVLLTLRHGSAVPGRRTFAVSAEETQRLATARGLRTDLAVGAPSVQAQNRAAGVEWTRLVFRRPADPR
jgi:SAM-dependent methyltransferase